MRELHLWQTSPSASQLAMTQEVLSPMGAVIILRIPKQDTSEVIA